MNARHVVGRFASIVGLAVAMTGIVTAAGGATSFAATPVGTCPDSYAAYTYDQLSFDPSAQAIFAVIDANGDGLVCFKPYPNGSHHDHDANLVDDKAAPHA
ncbi:MAG TPA: hypothetical protein VKR22_00650 [Acidimicrobiales bacterium]|nr:hypothetical protein [Acidimicrobiales bacterium]